MCFKKFMCTLLLLLICLSSHASDSKYYTESEFTYESNRYGDFEVSYKDGSEFTWDRYGGIYWSSKNYKYSKSRYGDVKLSCGAKLCEKDRYGSSCVRGYSQGDVSKIEKYISELGKKTPLRTIESIIEPLNIKENVRDLQAEKEEPKDLGDQEMLCIVCVEKAPAQNMILSCGHANLCEECMSKIIEKNMTCPTCRVPAKIIKIFK